MTSPFLLLEAWGSAYFGAIRLPVVDLGTNLLGSNNTPVEEGTADESAKEEGSRVNQDAHEGRNGRGVNRKGGEWGREDGGGERNAWMGLDIKISCHHST